MYENTGALFKNENRKSDKSPDYTGSWKDENGKKWRLAAWLKDGKKGKFLSIRASEFLDRGGEAKQAGEALPDDSIPF